MELHEMNHQKQFPGVLFQGIKQLWLLGAICNVFIRVSAMANSLATKLVKAA